jgi:hypothetical protein
MTQLKYFEPSTRIALADEMLPLLVNQGLWYELRETTSYGWQLYVPMLVNKHTHHFVNLRITQPSWLGAKCLVQFETIDLSLKEAILILQELQTVYTRLEARVLSGDWRNSDTYETISPECSDAELLQFILAHC